MFTAVRLLLVGYGIGALIGVLMAAAFGGGFTGAMSGILAWWLGGAVMTLLVAYGWHRGLWLQKWCDPETGSRALDRGRDQAQELQRWQNDLSAEEFSADWAADIAANSDGHEGKGAHRDTG